MTPKYPQFYLDGNIALQNTVDDFRDWTRKAILKWLALTCMVFTLTLVGVVFELPWMAVTGLAELSIFAIVLHVLLTPQVDVL